MRKDKVFLDDLPRWGRNEKGNEGTINWKKCIGYKVKFTYDGIEGEVEIIDYEAKKQYLYLKYLNKDIFKINTGNFKKCQLGILLDKHTVEFKIKMKQSIKDKRRDLVILDREYRLSKNNHQNEKWYKYKCNKCSYDQGWIVEDSLLKGRGCACCRGLTVVEGINDISTTDPWMVKYFVNHKEAKLYTKSSHHKIQPICPDCGKVKNKSISIYKIYTYHSIGCSCSDGQSYPFKFMFNILEQLEIDFETEYSPDWIKPKRYDFYFKLNDKEYIIETDGGWHNSNNNLSGQTAKESKEIDDYKDKLADEHGIKVIRIDSKISELEFIKSNILSSELNNLFNLTDMNWIECEEFALSNLVKKACEMKRDNPDMTTTQIGEMMNLDRVTIVKYLKKGSKIWDWCEYDPKVEMKNSGSKRGKAKGRFVEIFKDNVSLGKFKSGADLSRQSEERFGVKLTNGSISAVCLGKWKQYKGYTFKYIEGNNVN